MCFRKKRDKPLYRDNIRASFNRGKKLFIGWPGYYFDVSPRGWGCGLGYYMAGADSIASLRQRLDRKNIYFRHDGENFGDLNSEDLAPIYKCFVKAGECKGNL